MQVFDERLQALEEAIGGVLGICLVARDGICVQVRKSAENLDLEALAAEVLTLVGRISDPEHDPSVGRVRGFSIAGDGLTLAVAAVTPTYYLLAALDDETRLGRARFELRRARLVFEPDLL
ncbi:MAG: hypothetical protein R3325_01130 [Thermoanaerobaculia bacterium]|nr:hypothetical protein [Thermoanaerobaculia bacterium]